MATVQRYVNTDSTAGGDGTTNDTAGATRAYATLDEWSDAMSAVAVATDDYIVDCCGTVADTAAVTLDWATDITSGSITVRGNRSDVAGFYTGNALISLNHYRLTNSGTSPMDLREANITLDGFQIEVGSGAFRSAIDIANSKGFTIKNMRLRASAATDFGIGSGGSPIDQNSARTVENCLIVGFNLAGIDLQIGNFRIPPWTIRHNTIYGDGSAKGVNIAEGSSAAGSYTIKGNAMANSGASADIAVSLASGSVTYADNALSDSLGTTDEIALGTTTDAWTNPGTLRTSDFSVKNTSSSLYNAVNPTLVTLDITEFTRDGSNHDVGAFELQGVGGGAAAKPMHAMPRGMYLGIAPGMSLSL